MRYRICPSGAGWKVQESYESLFRGTLKWRDCLTPYYLSNTAMFFVTESDAKEYIKGRIRKDNKTAINKAKGCYEWPPREAN